MEVCLEGGITERAAITCGASTGSFEAHELRDGDERYRGEGVCKAVRNVCEEISGYLAGTESTRQIDIDNMLIELDGTEDRSRLGANAMLVGFACRGPGFRGFPECPLHGYLGVLLVGDDLLATNAGRLRRGIREKAANAILVKLNQIGTLTETLEVIRVAGEADFKRIVAHRSGETEDTSIADLAVATNCAFIKSGAPARTGESV